MMNENLSKSIECLFDEVVRLKLSNATGEYDTPLAIAMYRGRLVKLIADECAKICDFAANIEHEEPLTAAEQLVVVGAKNQAGKLATGIREYFGVNE